MITGSYDELKDLAAGNVCAEHLTPLEVAWHGPDKRWVLRCGRDHYPDAITRTPSLTESWREGEELPEPVEHNIERRENKRAIYENGKKRFTTFRGVPVTDLGTGELLPQSVMQALVDYAATYKLDPARGHVCLMYGKPYITLDGYLYHANRSGTSYALHSWSLEENERKTYQIEDGSHAWFCEVIMKTPDRSFTGLGIVTLGEMTELSSKRAGQLRSPVVARHPWQLAQKRAEWQALRRAFPIGAEPDGKEE